jgi:hypothetical protein
MTQGVVVVYFSRLGGWLRPHQKLMLEVDAKAIARVKQYAFGGRYRDGLAHSGRIYFVPDETLLVEEASSLGITSARDLYGGVVPQPFVKTKSIAHRSSAMTLSGRTAGRIHSRSRYTRSYCVAIQRFVPATRAWQRFACCRTVECG